VAPACRRRFETPTPGTFLLPCRLVKIGLSAADSSHPVAHDGQGAARPKVGCTALSANDLPNVGGVQRACIPCHTCRKELHKREVARLRREAKLAANLQAAL
jgi:hypothetical protein